MRVTLLSPQPDAIADWIVWVAGRTCYSQKTPSELAAEYHSGAVSKQKIERFIRDRLNEGHHSLAEHLNFTLAVEGVSRVLLAQLSRHRHISLSVQSGRYVSFDDPDMYTPRSLDEGRMGDVGEDVSGARLYAAHLNQSALVYERLLEHGFEAEDARYALPEATTVNLVLTANLRSLIDVSALRLCTLAQAEIRYLFAAIKNELRRAHPFLGSLLLIKCQRDGYCDELRNLNENCRVAPHKQRVMAVFEKYGKQDWIDRKPIEGDS